MVVLARSAWMCMPGLVLGARPTHGSLTQNNHIFLHKSRLFSLKKIWARSGMPSPGIWQVEIGASRVSSTTEQLLGQPKLCKTLSQIKLNQYLLTCLFFFWKPYDIKFLISLLPPLPEVTRLPVGVAWFMQDCGSNPRPHACYTSTLPTELHPWALKHAFSVKGLISLFFFPRGL